MFTVAEPSGTPSKIGAACGKPWKWIECGSNRSGRCAMPTFVRLRNTSWFCLKLSVGAASLALKVERVITWSFATPVTSEKPNM